MQFKSLGLRAAMAFSSLAVFAQCAWAIEPFTVRDIRVEGLQRVEAGTVFASLPVRIGEAYNDEKGASAIRSLFSLGLFKDVRIEVSGDVLVVIVEERPTVAEVTFSGTREFEKDVLTKALRDVGLSDGRPFDKALVDRAEQELKRQYINRSLYAAEVVTTITPIERNRVNVSFAVIEGDLARIKDIHVVGSKTFDEASLLGLFDLDTGGWLSWYTKSDRYSRAKLNADLETLKSYYLQRGFMEFRVDSTQVAISPNKQDISITVNITEGERFVVSGVQLEGNFLGRDDEFKSLVAIRPGQPFNADLVTQTTKAFADYFGSFGFAFARVEARPEVDRNTNRVKLVLQAEPSRRAYVRRINIAGNSRTRDEVVRREFRQFEASWYDSDKIKLSRDRVDRLGYFRDVAIETAEVPGSPDQVDLTVTVTEKPTGSLSVGAGYSSSEGIGVTFGINQDNAFGSGNSLGLQVNTSKINRTVVFNTTDPYFTQDGVSRAVDLYHRNSSPYLDINSYKLVTTGLSMRFGVPFTENDTVYFGAGAERTNIQVGTHLPLAYKTYGDTYGYGMSTVPLTIGWARDSRDSALAPTLGRYQRANAEWGATGNARYVKANYQYQQYVPLSKQLTAAFNTELAWGGSVGNSPYPIFKNVFGGGLGSVRGFEQGSLGPVDASGARLGGSSKVNVNTEVLAPFPGAGNDRTLRMYGFVDAGAVYASDVAQSVNANASDLRVSTGVGISWISPVGPLRLAFARPLRKFTGDKIQNVQFQIGTAF